MEQISIVSVSIHDDEVIAAYTLLLSHLLKRKASVDEVLMKDLETITVQ